MSARYDAMHTVGQAQGREVDRVHARDGTVPSGRVPTKRQQRQPTNRQYGGERRVRHTTTTLLEGTQRGSRRDKRMNPGGAVRAIVVALRGRLVKAVRSPTLRTNVSRWIDLRTRGDTRVMKVGWGRR